MAKSRLVLVAAFLAMGGLVWFTLRARTQSAGSRTPSENAIRVGFRVGERAPDFELRALNERSVKLSALRGKPVLLNFWATWCTPCRVEMPWLVELDRKYGTLGLQIVGVSMDDSGATHEVAAFTKEIGVKYQVLLGNQPTADAYGGVRFMPQSFFIDSNGNITKAVTGLTNKQDLEDGIGVLFGNTSGQGPGASDSALSNH